MDIRKHIEDLELSDEYGATKHRTVCGKVVNTALIIGITDMAECPDCLRGVGLEEEARRADLKELADTDIGGERPRGTAYNTVEEYKQLQKWASEGLMTLNEVRRAHNLHKLP